jgi:hypothetical protein
MAEQTELNLETMPLADLKAAALAEEAKEPEIVEEPKAEAAPEADIETPVEAEPEQFFYKKEIDLGDGSGVQVFTGKGTTALEALEELSEKLADAQRHATKKIHELSAKVKAEDTRTEQQKTDDEYVIAQRLQKEPSKAIRDVVREVIAEREESQRRSLQTQQNFVDSHPDYIADTENGARITHEVQRLGYNEFTEESLEKAYQSLKASGLLKVKAEEAGGTTEAEATPVERLAQPVAEVTQPRSPKRASTVSTRSSAPPVVKTGPTEDELYSMPLAKLRQLSNEQLAKAAQE